MTSAGTINPKNRLGQYFTPRRVADLMVAMSNAPADARVLEPCSGAGVFLDALRDAGYRRVEAVELDPGLARHAHVDVRQESFVSAALEPGFRLVIGNPPYIRWRNLDEAARDELEQSELWARHFNGLCDYLTIFIARSVELLCAGGELIFITPSFWMHTMHSAGLRDFMLARGAITDLVHFGEAEVFPKVASSIVIFRYVRRAAAPSTRLVRYTGPRKVDVDASDYGAFLASDQVEIGEIPAFEAGAPWVLATESVQERLNALENACRARTTGRGESPVTRLGMVADIANGMVSGLDAAFRIPPDLTLNADEDAARIDVVKGFSLAPYLTTGTTPYIFVAPGLSEAEFEQRFPAFCRQLTPFRERLEARYSYGRDLRYWEWAFLRSFTFFQAAESLIFVPCKERLSNKSCLRFALAPSGSFPTQDVTAIGLKHGVRESPLYLLALLNSPRLYEWVRYKGLMKGEIAEFSEKPLSTMPLRLVDWTSGQEAERHDRIVEDVALYLERGEPGLIDRVNADVDALLFG